MATFDDLNNDPSVLETLSDEEKITLWEQYESADEKPPLGGPLLQQLSSAAVDAYTRVGASQDATVEDHGGDGVATADPQSPESAG